MKKIFTIILILYSVHAFSQGGTNKFNLPEILPPSPDVAAITKGAELSATPHTGGANARIPIYDLKVSGFTLPISLNYATNGYKPEEIPSRVGLGWSLNAGGVVSRITRGKPDDYCSPVSNYLTEAQIMQFDAEAHGFITDLENQNGNHDGMPDEYRYNVNGLSGKFIFKRDGSILQMPYNNIRIQVARYINAYGANAITDIFITDGNGVKYTFGAGVFEETMQHNLTFNIINKQHIITAWMLTKITLPNGNFIDFNYSTVNHSVSSGLQQSVRKGIVGVYCTPPPPQNEISCPVDAEYSERMNFVQYSSKCLVSIIANTGQSIIFHYVDRPDSGGDNRIDYISINNGYGQSVKKVELEYLDKQSNVNLQFNQGYFLKKVLQRNPTDTSEVLGYELSYVDEANSGAGAAYSLNVDHLGFANGANNTTLLPVVDTMVINGYPLFQNEGTANREPNGNYSKKGILEKITYPTGGYDQYFYEPNMKTWWDSAEVKEIKTARCTGAGSNYPYQFYNKTFTVYRRQTVELHLKTEWMGAPPIPDGDPAPKTAFARIYNTTTNEVVRLRMAEGFAGGAHYKILGDFNFELLPGLYRLELEVRYGENANAQADLVYDAGNTKEWKELNEELCGVRVRKILFYDPLSKKSHSKFYFYKSFTDTSIISANKRYYATYVTPHDNGLFCESMEVVCPGYILSSNSATTLYLNEAAGVTYNSVIEADDSTFANGFIQHNFITQDTCTVYQLLGVVVPNAPMDMYNYMNGVEKETFYFNKDKKVIKQISNYYSIDNRVNNFQTSNYLIRKRYNKIMITSPWSINNFINFDINSFHISAPWHHIDSTVTIDFDLVNNKSIKTIKSFTYGTIQNAQPSIIKSRGSDQAEEISERKFATDFEASNSVCSTMVSRNMIDPVLEEKSFKNNKLLYQTNTAYKDWFNNGSLLTPEIILGQKGNNVQENRIHYYQYDAKGNPLEVAKENDVRVSYIWDYNEQLPIAEITNGSWGSGVAFTSFEAGGKGGWSFSGVGVSEGTESNGEKCYLLSNGSISYSGNLVSGKKYFVSYWSKGGSVSVNGTTGTLMITKNGWKLFRHTINYSSGNITVSGTGYIDELRLYPDGAFMKTFTYKPEIGITSTSDINSLFQTYEYDGFNRLLRIRDMDKNILKQYEYKFNESITPCTDTIANWQPTGNIRCAKNSNNNNLGYKEREEINVNNCSESYQGKRWVSIGASPECIVVPNCSGPDKRVINGQCVTGCKQLIKSEYLGDLQWRCTYRYYWQLDGYWGPALQETSFTDCQNYVCPE